MKWLLLRLIAGYQRGPSPGLPPACRYRPTCRPNAGRAVERHRAPPGTGPAAKRLARCTPWGRSGYDPVP